MASESRSPDEHGHVDAEVSPPRPTSPPCRAVSAQETEGSTNASDSTVIAPIVQEVPRNGMAASTLCAIHDDDPPIPLWQVADHEKESEGPQLHDGPPGPPRFPHELDDSRAKKVGDTERVAFPAFEDRLRHKVIGSRERAVQETRGSANVGDMTAAPTVQEDVIQGGATVSTIHSMNDDERPIPLLQVPSHEKSEGSQARRVADEFERDSSDLPRDNAPTVNSRTGAFLANVADVDPPVVGTTTSANTTSPGAAGRAAANSGAATSANAGTRTIVLPQAKMVSAEDDDEPKPIIVASVVLPFYRRKGFVCAVVTAAMALLAAGIAAAVQHSINVKGYVISTARAKLLAPDGAAGDEFGESVAIYRDTIVVGTYLDDDNGENSGSTHVFVRSEEEWTHRAKLLAPDGAAVDQFGRSVAIYGDTIVVGANGDDDNGSKSGSAHVFVRSEEEWTHQAKLLAPDGAADDFFGFSVAIYGDTIVVGAYWDDDFGFNGSSSGSAHVFVRSGESWTHQAKLLAPNGAAVDQFGRSVAIYGDTIAVGAPYDDDNEPNRGSAHVFVRSKEEWTHRAKLLAPDGAAGDYFGWSVAIHGDTIVVGAYDDDDNGSNSGSAHVFVRSGESWTHQAKLLAPDGAASDQFGWSVAIQGDTTVVSAVWDNDNGWNSGSTHVLIRSGEEWIHQAKLLAPDGARSDYFGRSVAIYGDTIVVGAEEDDDNGSGSGSAHVFVV